MSTLILLTACGPESAQTTQVVIEGAAVDILESTLWENEITLDRPTWVRSPAVLSIAAGTHISFLPGSGLWIDGQVDAEPGVTFEAVGAMLDANDGVVVSTEDWFSDSPVSRLDGSTFVGVNLVLEQSPMDELNDLLLQDATLTVRRSYINLHTLHAEGGPRTQGRDLVTLEDVEYARIEDANLWAAPDLDLAARTGDGIVFSGAALGLELIRTNISQQRTAVRIDANPWEDGQVFCRECVFDANWQAGVDLLRGEFSMDFDSEIYNGLHGIVAAEGTTVQVSSSYVDGMASDCIRSAGDVNVDTSILRNCARGVVATGVVTVNQTVTEGMDGAGIDAGGLMMFDSTVQNSGAGVIVRNGGLSIVDNSGVFANDGDGVQGPAEDNGVEVTTSDIIGNSGWAVNNARAVAGCHGADNHGVLGVDALEAGEADGQFDIDTDQMTGIDQVTTPALSPLGAGS